MIKYKLACKDCEITFDSWFASSKEFEKLKKKHLLVCHICNSKAVDKSLMAPSLRNNKKDIKYDLQLDKYENVKKCKSELDAKKIAFSIANSSLVKTAIAGEDPNWGRIIMAIGKAGPNVNIKKLSIKFGDLKIVQDGKLHQNYDEKKTSEYMKNDYIDFDIEIFTGSKNFTVYTMDFTKKYVEINADYRS